MGLIRDTNDFVTALYAEGSANNEDLQRMLILLKDISDSRPEALMEDFLEIFPGVDINQVKQDGVNIMLMMFLTRLAMMYKPTKTSQGFMKARQVEEDLVIKLREVEHSFKDYLQSRFT